MMGICATSFEAPTIKGTAGVLFFTEEEDRHVDEPTCIRCGKCITVCPMNLEPVFMYMYYSKGDFENMAKYHITDCFECGSCSFNCPARMPLTHAFKTAKLMFQAKAAKEKAAGGGGSRREGGKGGEELMEPRKRTHHPRRRLSAPGPYRYRYPPPDAGRDHRPAAGRLRRRMAVRLPPAAGDRDVRVLRGFLRVGVSEAAQEVQHHRRSLRLRHRPAAGSDAAAHGSLVAAGGRHLLCHRGRQAALRRPRQELPEPRAGRPRLPAGLLRADPGPVRRAQLPQGRGGRRDHGHPAELPVRGRADAGLSSASNPCSWAPFPAPWARSAPCCCSSAACT